MEDLETDDDNYENVKHVDDHLIDINTDSDHVAANEEDDHSDEQHGYLLIPSLPAGDPVPVPAGGPPDRLPQHQVHDRDQQERNQKHHHKICGQDVIPANKQTN